MSIKPAIIAPGKIEPSQISVPDDTLNRLSQRLSLTEFPSQLEGPEQWDFGVPVSEMKRLTNYWRHGFDWRKVESRLNELPHFRTTIEVDGFGGIDIHCKLTHFARL